MMGDKKGEALRLACPGSLATVVRSDDTYLSTGRACVYAYSSLLIVYVSACREYTHVQRVRKNAYTRAKKCGLVAGRKIYIHCVQVHR